MQSARPFALPLELFSLNILVQPQHSGLLLNVAQHLGALTQLLSRELCGSRANSAREFYWLRLRLARGRSGSTVLHAKLGCAEQIFAGVARPRRAALRMPLAAPVQAAGRTYSTGNG